MKLNNDKRDIKTDSTEILKNPIYYCKKLHANKLDNLEVVNKFLEMYNVQRLNHKNVESLDIYPKKPETLN